MDTYVTEQQQIEHIKKWWQHNGKFIILALILAVCATVGYQVYQRQHEKMLAHASDHYEWMLSGLVGNNPLVVQAQSRYILKRYPRTPYALLAALMQARQAVYDTDFATAEDKLSFVMHHAQDKSLQQMARIRLARVQLTERKPEQALATLATVNEPTFKPAIDAVKGDIYVAMAKYDDAKAAYRAAISGLTDDDPMQPLLQMKLDDLATNNDLRLTA